MRRHQTLRIESRRQVQTQSPPTPTLPLYRKVGYAILREVVSWSPFLICSVLLDERSEDSYYDALRRAYAPLWLFVFSSLTLTDRLSIFCYSAYSTATTLLQTCSISDVAALLIRPAGNLLHCPFRRLTSTTHQPEFPLDSSIVPQRLMSQRIAPLLAHGSPPTNLLSRLRYLRVALTEIRSRV